MKKPDQDQLVAYLYGETDESTANAITEHLDTCVEDRSQVERWRATMNLLDTWELDDPGQKRRRYFPRLTPFLKVAAVITAVASLGFVLGQQFGKSPEVAKNEETPQALEAAVVERVALALEQERAALLEHRRDIEAKLLMASASVTHRQVQGYVHEALRHLKETDVRNETLAMFLPPEEQAAYQEKRRTMGDVAEGVNRETARQQAFMEQIIARAKARAKAPAH